MAARHAASRITDDEVKELRGLHEAMVATDFPGELPRYRELNRRFHEVIFEASGRSYLVRTLAQLWSAFPTMLWSNIPRVAVTSVPERDKPDTVEHAEIVEAFVARDPARAERAVRYHIEAAGKSLVSAMREQE